MIEHMFDPITLRSPVPCIFVIFRAPSCILLPVSRRDDGSSGKIEIHLEGDELRYFDELRADMSRVAFASILLNWAIEHPEDAFNHHFSIVRAKFGKPPGGVENG